jgi:hypothetical protein
MLIYTANKEFVGIDEKDLKTLGFKDFLGLRKEVSDFADLFVKTPGYIHNFKHVHWIDYITCTDSSEEFQVIINANNRNFKSKITIETLYLNQNPSVKSYVVYLNGIKELSKKESENISADIAQRPLVRTVSPVEIHETEEIEDVYDAPQEHQPAVVVPQIDPYETPLDVSFDDDEDFVDEVPLAKEPVVAKESVTPVVQQAEVVKESPTVKTVSVQKKEHSTQLFDNGYIYDPQVASNELGLPLDLIEEFIQDFIAQAKEFQEGIYAAIDASEFDQVKSLSHKLKGVAANLRIEDAFDTLNTVNTSNDIHVIRENIEIFYKIIAKLAQEEIVVEESVEVPAQETISLDFKEEVNDVNEEDDLYVDLLFVEDSQVPQKIEIAELADDEFTSSDVDFGKLDEELEKIEDIEFLELDKESNSDENLVIEFAEDVEEIQEEMPTINYSKESVASEIGIDIGSFNELFEDYVNEGHAALVAMKEAVEIGDFAVCSHEAMKLQGMSDNMRVYGFEEDLEVLIHSTKKDEVLDSINRVDYIISHISKVGV